MSQNCINKITGMLINSYKIVTIQMVVQRKGLTMLISPGGKRTHLSKNDFQGIILHENDL